MVDASLPPEDFEIVSFLVAGLSYGRVEQILRSSEKLLRRLESLGMGAGGRGIARWLLEANPERDPGLSRALAGWVHRFNTRADMIGVMGFLSRTLREDGSLCRSYQLDFEDDPAEQFQRFVDRLRSRIVGPLRKGVRSRTWKGAGPAWFVPTPADLGTCKRLLMWLRWMVRHDAIDPGTWRKLADPTLPLPVPARLLWPVDTHIFRWAKQRRLITRTSPSWKSTLELTHAFRVLRPEDPVRYDFAICHQGMANFRQR